MCVDIRSIYFIVQDILFYGELNMTMMCTGKVSPPQLTPTAHYYVCGASPSPQ